MFSSGMNRPVLESQPVMFPLLQAAHALEHRLETTLAGVGLSVAKFKVVSQLADAGESLPLSELASRQSCVRSNMTQLIDRMEVDGLVRRVDDPTDRRSVRAAITPLGQERAEAGARLIKQVEEELAAAIPLDDRAALIRLFGGIK